jgi:hypothetical protein
LADATRATAEGIIESRVQSFRIQMHGHPNNATDATRTTASMSTPTQPALQGITDTRPRTIEVQGERLLTVIAEVNVQGGHVESVTFDRKRGNAAWTLRIHWPGEPRA